MSESKQSTEEKHRRNTIIVLLSSCLLAIISLISLLTYDLIVYFKGGNEATLSKVILDTSKDWPIIPLLIGLLFGLLSGHLFWPQTK